ncbi:tRNA lysidine(34) synthetase TilS [Asaia bogorensis]|uniref:tRNA lysidine(34) synthetase TilS n=1 Tax=Asaia bogorensis TaxID=91915 RepID=UPI000EFC559A|nr:tRNA lysidine(34) synthetase TilS [Asaia bogorensis]
MPEAETADRPSHPGAGPIAAGEFAALMQGFGAFPSDEPRFPLGVAVSGGADSLCLAWLLRRWRRSIRAFVVDHGLRQDSAAEAALTASRLAALAIPVSVLRIKALDGTRRLQETARAARYQILAEACAAHGILDLALGHHAGDQAETFLMRKAHGSTPYGLASMAFSRETPHLRYLRPLLSIAPERLRATLQAQDIEWVEDPSNQKRCFERVRIRQDMDAATRCDTLVEAGTYGTLRNRRSEAAARWLASIRLDPAGYAVMTALPDDPALLGQIWQMISGAAYPPSPSDLAGLIASPRAMTLSGAILFKAGRYGEGWILAREVAAIRAQSALCQGLWWDRRFKVRGAPMQPGLSVGALGPESRRYRHHSLPSRVLAALPALWRGGSVVGVPTLGEGISQDWPDFEVAFEPAVSLSDRSSWPEYRETVKT